MTTDIEGVRQVLRNTEDVSLADGMASPPDAQPVPEYGSQIDPYAGMEPDRDPGAPSGPDDTADAETWDRIREAAEEPLNDTGNGARFAIHFGHRLMWVPRVGWFVWGGKVWAKDPDGVATRVLAQQIAPLMARETAFITVPPAKAAMVGRKDAITAAVAELAALKTRTLDQETDLAAQRSDLGLINAILGQVQDRIGQRLTFAKTTGNSDRMKNMTGEAGVNLARPLTALDAAPLDVNTETGVLRFSVTSHGKFRRAEMHLVPHDPAFLMTKIMPVAYDPDARAPQFQTFLNRIQPEAEVQGFLQRIGGLAMLGAVEQIIVFLYGDGANGKSVLVDLIARILGDYAASAKIESLTGSNRRGGGDATPDLVPMIGARFLRTSEPDQGMQWQEGLIKELTGGEPILIRALHSDFIPVRPEFTLLISGNHKPDFRGTDDGIWRRVKLVPFAEQIPEAERIPKAEMDAMLFAEAPGILNWLIEGALAYLEGGIMEPEQVRDATRQLREESDPYGAFLDEACHVTGDPDDAIKALDLVNAFHFWLGSRGEGQFKDRTVSMKLKDRSRRWRSRRTGQKFTELKSGGVMRYTGLRLTPIFQRLWDDAPKDQRGRPLFSSTGASANSANEASAHEDF